MAKAWLVAYVDPTMEPPAICEAGIFAENRPIKAERHARFAQLVLLQTEADTHAQAADEIKKILAGPEWRWIYRVPVLTAGFLHAWQAGRCRVCGIREDSPARSAGRRDPDRCLVSHVGLCSGCGEQRAILQGDALCALCRYPAQGGADVRPGGQMHP
ncbi:MAG TPA: hypothetical protein VF881_00245 [Polyangiaceae bacterium]